MATTRVTAEYRCADCAAEFDHCHGTLFVHIDGTSECTSHGCSDLDLARHPLTAACADLDGCACVTETTIDLAVAS